MFFLIQEQKTDQIIWISTINSDNTFYLINAASNNYLRTGTDSSDQVIYRYIRTDSYEIAIQNEFIWSWIDNVYLKSKNNDYILAIKRNSLIFTAINPVGYADKDYYKKWTQDFLF